jgi:hypothetical protein
MATLRRPVVVALIAAAAVVTAAFAALALRSSRPAAPAPSLASTEGPGTVAAAAPAADPSVAATPSAAGARAAALAYLALSERVVGIDVEAAVAAQRDAATATAAPRLVAELRQRLGALTSAFPGGGLRYRVGPLAVRTELAGAERARVEVWYVGVLAAPGVAPYEQWRLSRYVLSWERGGWRVAAESTGPGPRPAAPVGPEPASTPALEAALAGFDSALAP